MLSVEGLVVRYGPIEAVRRVSLHVPAGTKVAVVGSNGAGKTSLLLAISGVLRPAAGRIVLDGTDLTGQPAHKVARAGVAQVVEGRAVFGTLTVRENLSAGAYSRNDRWISRDMDHLLSVFPVLRERLSQPAATLSGGEQQMLAIARAMMSRPRLLLLDEPSMGLAPLIVHEIYSMLRELHSGGLTMLLVEQNARRAVTFSDHSYVMARGEFVASGSGAELLEGGRVERAYLGAAIGPQG